MAKDGKIRTNHEIGGNDENAINTRHSSPTTAVEDERLDPLSVVIVGAGIGGLTAAIYLRKQGHRVIVLEQSHFANETGAAVHLAPNSNGILRRIGVNAEEFGANELRIFTNYSDKGELLGTRDNTAYNTMWQHKYLLVHRARLHQALKKKATSPDWPGAVVELQTSSRVVDADPLAGIVTLENGEVVRGDVIIAADGVHSILREKIPPGDITPRSSEKSAFRFLLPKSALLELPDMIKYAQHDGELIIWCGSHKRMVMYPCNNNTMLNFVAIHPAEETDVHGGEYNHKGEKDQLLKVFRDFDPALLALVSKVDEETLKLWPLLDMEVLPSWTIEKLALLGDAAHPYTPHQGQGAGQAMEDGAAIAVVLPLGTKPNEVPERLQLFQKFRYDRATRIQVHSRKVGEDAAIISGSERQSETIFHLAHDEWDSALQKFRKWQWAQKPTLYWRMPTSFGPMPGPRQDIDGRLRNGTGSTSTTMSIKFQTSRTLLDGLLPNDRFSFSSQGTVAYATFSQMTLDKMDWLGGGGYNIFQLILHDVQYKKKNGDTIRGNFLPLLFENLPDPILSGREELGMPKLYCNIDVHRRTNSIRAQLSWRGAVFGSMTVEDLQEVRPEIMEVDSKPNDDLPPGASFMWRVIPPVGIQGQSESEYCAMTGPPNNIDAVQAPQQVMKANRANIQWDPLDWEALPTIHHIVSRLAEIPFFEVVEARLTHTVGVSDLSNTRKVE